MEVKPYVRTAMLDGKPAPVTSSGPAGWLKKNLFDGPWNTAATLVALVVVFLLLSHLLPWVFQSVWNAENLAECREIIDATWGPEHSGACWAVIHDRYLQLIYGFYPWDFLWRPNLTFAMMLVAIAPVLFTQLPRKMLIFSCLFPFIGAWLLWGGSIWQPVMVLAGFGIGAAAFRYLAKVNRILSIAAAIVLPVIWWVFVMETVVHGLHAVIPLGLEPVQSNQFGGFMVSIIIGLTAITCSLPLGIMLALGRQTELFIVRTFSVGFIEFIRGVPLITLLFVASTLLNYFMPPGTNFDLIVRVIIMATLFSSAYIAEVVRGGLAALPKGQYEAADSLGLDYWQAQQLIIMPQALKIAIPGIVSTFIGLFKDTTLVSIIGILDPIGLSNAIRADSAWNGIYWELFAFIGFVFFIFCFSMSRYSMYLERKLNTGHR
ncbi:amino acid ABC transporter permease [Poseidonocella sp. HB161398]|uniref:amino acid ABC transporter permease n=1 Tax=Poseidonocella sp. HB161398 TaxID=2320855 RepID=UPI0011089FA5|nr:amino acid ABC transporter permease [Poseidonocella sp. HB161398]